MNKDEFLIYAQSEIERLHNDPLLRDYFNELKHCQMVLNIFQWVTIGIIALLVVRFMTIDETGHWSANKILLSLSGILLLGMLFYEYFNYECMSKGDYGVPIGLQLISLIAVFYFYIQKERE